MTRGYRLVTFEAKEAHYLARAAHQIQSQWISDHMLRVFGNELTANHQLPKTIMTSFEDQHFDASTSVVLQILDASSLFIKRSEPSSYNSHRHLTRFEVVVWSSSLQPGAIDGPTKLKLDCGRRRRLFIVLDRPFEIGLTAMKPWNFLAMLMRRDTFVDLYIESKQLDDMLDAALCLGFKVEPGREEQQVVENDRAIDIAYDKAVWVFDEMDQLDAVLAPVLTQQQVAAYLKRGAYLEAPTLRDWKAEIGIDPLSTYLEEDNL